MLSIQHPPNRPLRREDIAMKFMMLLKADTRTEAGELPSRQDLEQMGKYNQELIDAGVMLDGAGLQASSSGARVTWKHGKPEVVDGPFAETKELIAGYWMIKANSLAEAIEWAKKAPFHLLPQEGGEPQIELRRVFELEDFPDVPEEVARMNEAFTTGGRHK
jgi:hypothetical protein